MAKKIHIWAENKDGKVFLIGCTDLNNAWYIPRGILSENVKITITYEEEQE